MNDFLTMFESDVILQIEMTPLMAWITLIVSALVLILGIALIISIFATARRTRKLKRMEKKLDELIAANKALLEDAKKMPVYPDQPMMFPVPQPPHPGSSWRRR